MGKKVFTVVLGLLIALTCTVGVFAQMEKDPRWQSISFIFADVTIDDGDAYVDVEVESYSSSYKVNMTVTLQKYNHSTAKWSTSKTWTASNSGNVSIYKIQSVTSGIYRLKVDASVYTSSGSFIESTTIYSQGATCP